MAQILKQSGTITLDTTGNQYGLGDYFEITEGLDAGITSVKLSVSRIHIQKEIYKPGQVEVELTFDNFEQAKSPKNYLTALKWYFLSPGEHVKLNVNSIGKDGEKVSAVKDYYICDMHMKQQYRDTVKDAKLESNTAVMTVVLKAYSPDFFLTLQKYSKTYRDTNNTLSNIIFNKIKGDEILNDVFVSKYLCHTTFSEKSKELNQPYLVQYDESFYDFVVRVANRCGELFFYENGKLYLGLSEASVDKDNKLVINTSSEDIVPLDMSFSNLPDQFTTVPTNLSQSLLTTPTTPDDNSTLYNTSNNVAAFDSLRKVDKDKDSMKWEDVVNPHVCEIPASFLSSGGLLPGLNGAVNKAISVLGSAAMLMNPDMFHINSEGDVKSIYLQQKDADDNNCYSDNVSSTSVSDDKFKALYQKQYPNEFRDLDKTANSNMSVDEVKKHWEDVNSPAHKALTRYMSLSDPLTDDEFKAKYEKNYKELFQTKKDGNVSEMSDDEKNKVWNDSTSKPYKDFEEFKNKVAEAQQNYKTAEYKALKKSKIEDENQNDFQSKDGKALTGAEKKKIWSDTSSSACKKLEEDFKDAYQKDALNSDEFKLARYKDKSDEDIKKVWDDTNSAAHKALTEFQQNKANRNLNELSDAFYNWIDKEEKKNSAHIQEIKISQKLPTCMLGDIYNLSLNDTEDLYLVCSIDTDIYTGTGQVEKDYVTTYNTESNVKYSHTGEVAEERQEDSLEYQKKVFPPLAEIPHIRKSGPQQAIVTNVSDPLRRGRVQVRYPWNYHELTEKKTVVGSASPWISVAAPYVGKADSGMLMTPDVDDYVMLDYEDGNIERPFVTGSIFHNSTNWGDTAIANGTQNFRNAHRAITCNGNGITWVDGNLSKFVGGMMPSVVSGAFNNIPNIGKLFHHDDWKWDWWQNKVSGNKKLGGGMILSDYYGIYSISMSSATRSINIDSPWGTVGISAFNGITISAPNGDVKIVGKNVSIEAGNEVKITSGTNIKPKKAEAGMDLAKAGMNALGSAIGTLAGTWLKNAANGFDYTKAFDLSFLRNVYEIIFRPVGGTLSLTSKRNVAIQAGKGKVFTPSSTLSTEAIPKNGIGGPFKLALKSLAGGDATTLAEKQDEKLDANVANISKEVVTLCQATNHLDKIALLKPTIDRFMQVILDCCPPEGQEARDREIMNAKYTTRNGIFGAVAAGEKLPDIKDLLHAGQEVQYRAPSFKDVYRNISAAYESLCSCFQDWKIIVLGSVNTNNSIKWAIANSYNEKCNGDGSSVDNIENVIASAVVDSVMNKLYTQENLASNGDKFANLYSLEPAAFVTNVETTKKLLKRALFLEFAKDSEKIEFLSDDYATASDDGVDMTVGKIVNGADADKNWACLASHVQIKADKKEESVWKNLVGQLLSGVGLSDIASYDDASKDLTFFGGIQKTFNINGAAGPRSRWDVSQEGAVLVSGQSNVTFKLGAKDNHWNPILNPTGDLKAVIEKNNIK